MLNSIPRKFLRDDVIQSDDAIILSTYLGFVVSCPILLEFGFWGFFLSSFLFSLSPSPNSTISWPIWKIIAPIDFSRGPESISIKKNSKKIFFRIFFSI